MQPSVIIQCARDHVTAVCTSAYQPFFEVLHCVHRPDELLVEFVDSLLEGEGLGRTSACDTHLIEPELEVIDLSFGQLQAIL